MREEPSLTLRLSVNMSTSSANMSSPLGRAFFPSATAAASPFPSSPFSSSSTSKMSLDELDELDDDPDDRERVRRRGDGRGVVAAVDTASLGGWLSSVVWSDGARRCGASQRPHGGHTQRSHNPVRRSHTGRGAAGRHRGHTEVTHTRTEVTHGARRCGASQGSHTEVTHPRTKVTHGARRCRATQSSRTLVQGSATHNTSRCHKCNENFMNTNSHKIYSNT